MKDSFERKTANKIEIVGIFKEAPDAIFSIPRIGSRQFYIKALVIGILAITAAGVCTIDKYYTEQHQQEKARIAKKNQLKALKMKELKRVSAEEDFLPTK